MELGWVQQLLLFAPVVQASQSSRGRKEGLEIGKHAEAVFQSRVQSKSTRRRTRGTGRKEKKGKEK